MGAFETKQNYWPESQKFNLMGVKLLIHDIILSKDVLFVSSS